MTLPPPTPRQSKVIWAALTGLAIATLIGLIVGLIWGLGRILSILAPVLWPLAVAGILAYLLDPLVDRFERRGMRRQYAITLVFAMAVFILAALFGSVVPQMVKETRLLAERVPGYIQRTQDRVENWVNNPPELVRRWFKQDDVPPSTVVTNSATGVLTTNAPVQAATPSGTNATPSLAESLDLQTLSSATSVVAKALPKIGSWLFGQVGRVASWFGILAGLALIPVYAFYLLLEKRGIESKWSDYLPVSNSSFKDELVFVISSINGYLIAFFRGQVLVAICDGVMYTIGFMAIGLPYAVLLGVFSVFLTLIPFLGAIITCTVALVIALVQYGDWLHPALVLVVFAVVQGLEGFVIAPKIMGGRVGLHPLTIIIAVMAGTTLLGGILGGILAIPLTAVLRVVLARYVWKRTLPQQE